MSIHRSPRTSARGVCALLLFVAQQGCGQNGLGDSTGSTCPQATTLTYQGFGQAFMHDHCVRCHGSFSTQQGVQASIDEIDRAAAAGPDTSNTYMPEDEDLSDGTRKKLGEWLACGAP